MSADVVTAAPEGSLLVRFARATLTRAVRGRLPRGTDWGEALLGEFEEAPTTLARLRWTASSLPLAWRERRRARRDRDGVPAAPRSLRMRVTRRVLVPAVLVVAAGFVVNWLVATIVDVPSPAMLSTFQIGDRVLVDKVGFHLNGLHRGDVVLVHYPKAYPGDSLKRVVGLPGDVMTCAGGNLYRDGVLVPNRDTDPGAQGGDSTFTCATVTVPAGHLYLAGDNRYNSADSTLFGPVPDSVVIGREVAVLWNISS